MPRAFTLVDAAVSLAITGIVAASAVMMHASLTKTFTATRKLADMSDRALSASSYVAKELLTAGGNGVPASMAVFVENNCAARGDYPACPNGSDRITIFAAVKKSPSCQVSHVDTSAGEPIRVSFWYRNAFGEPRCCFNDEKNGSREPGVYNQYLKRHAMMVQTTYRRGVILIAEAGAPGAVGRPAPDSPADYNASWDQDEDGFVDTRCTFRVIDVMPPEQRDPVPPEFWLDAQVAIMDMRTLYIDATDPSSEPVLVMHTDLDDNGGGLAPTLSNSGTAGGPWGWTDPVDPPVDETITILDGVYDLQLSMGFDTLNNDGIIDKWVYAIPGNDSNRLRADDRFLRLLRLDMVIGGKAMGAAATTSVPTPARHGGATFNQNGRLLRAVSITLAPRNSDSLFAGAE